MSTTSAKILRNVITALLTLALTSQAAASNCGQFLSRPAAKKSSIQLNDSNGANAPTEVAQTEKPVKKSKEEVLLDVMEKQSAAVVAKLEGQPDPFVAQGVFDSESAFRLMDSLSYEKVPGSDTKRLSVLGDVRKFMHSQSMQKTTYTPELKTIVKRIYHFSKDQINLDSPTKANLYRAYLALELLLPYLYKIQPLPAVDRDGDKEEEKKKNEEKKDEEKEEEQEQDEEDSTIPELPEDYDPKTKDTDKEGDKNQKKPKPFLHIQLNGKTAYFKQRNFNLVTRTGENRFFGAPIPGFQPSPVSNNSGAKRLKINIGPDKVGQYFSLFVPSGFAPTAFSGPNFTIQQEKNGNYKIKLDATSVEIEVAKDIFDLTNAVQKEFLTVPVGVGEKEWPDSMKNELFPLLKGQNPVRQAELVEAYIRNRFLYSIDARAEKDPIDALNAGAFQCDMAAMIMVSVLRDYLKIPSRPVGGFRAKAGGKDSSVLFLPSEGHAWVEVFHNDQVYTFDPTPKNKDRKKDEKGDAGAAADEQKEFDDETFPSEEQEQEDIDKGSKSDSDKKSDKESNKKSKDGKESDSESDGKPQQGAGSGKGKKQDSKDGKDAQGSDGADGGKDKDGKEKSKGGAGAGDEKKPTAEEIHQAQEQLENELEIGSLSLKGDKSFNKLIDRAVRVMIRDINAPQFDSNRAHKILPLIKAHPHLRTEKYMKLFEEATQAVQYKQGPLVEALLQLSSESKKSPLNTSYKKLLQMIDRLELFLKLSDPSRRSKDLVAALDLLKKAQDEYLKLTKPKAHEIAVVRKFMTELPPHSRRIFANKFKIKNVDQGIGIAEAYQALIKTQVKDLSLIRTVYPLTNFILDSVPTPSYKRVTTQEELSRSEAIPEFTPLQSLQRSQYAIRGQQQKSVYENLKAGTLYLKTRFREVDVASPGGITDPYRVTIGLYDTSGSMSGEPGDFQASLLAAFTDRALSDVGPSGLHRHIVQLMGFDDEVHSPTKVTNSEEAYNVIKEYRKSMANTGGGTNIQKALQQAFAAILDAQKRAGEPLASANIVLMTDGQSEVDLKQLREWRAAIDRKTQVKILFVAINDTNPELMKLATEVKSAGVNEAYYYEFSPQDITKHIKDSQQPPKVDMKRDYHSDASSSQLSPNVGRYLEQASALVRKGIADYENYVKAFGHDKWDKFMESIPYREGEGKPAYLKEMQIFREFINAAGMFNESRLNTIVLDEVLRNHQNLTGRDFKSLDVKEVEITKWVIFQLRKKLQ